MKAPVWKGDIRQVFLSWALGLEGPYTQGLVSKGWPGHQQPSFNSVTVLESCRLYADTTTQKSLCSVPELGSVGMNLRLPLGQEFPTLGLLTWGLSVLSNCLS